MTLLNQIMSGNMPEPQIDELLLNYWDDIGDESLEYKTASLIFNIKQELDEWLEEHKW